MRRMEKSKKIARWPFLGLFCFVGVLVFLFLPFGFDHAGEVTPPSELQASSESLEAMAASQSEAEGVVPES